MKLNPKINISGKLGRGIETFFDYVCPTRLDSSKSNYPVAIVQGIIIASTVTGLASYFFPNYPAHTADNLLFGNNYPSRQEVLNVVEERAVRQYEREEILRKKLRGDRNAQMAYDKNKERYEKLIQGIEEETLRDMEIGFELEKELQGVDRKMKEYNSASKGLAEGMKELREGAERKD